MVLVKILDRINTIANIVRLKILYGNRIKFGNRISIRGKLRVRLAENAEIIIGNNCFFNADCSLNAKESILIGKDTLFGESVKVYDHDHIFNSQNEPIRKCGYRISPVSIGENCWICSNAIVLRGVNIGAGCVVGASEVVRSSIEGNTLLKGNALPIRRRKI